MNWKLLVGLIVLYVCGFISGMSAAFEIDAHLALISRSEQKP